MALRLRWTPNALNDLNAAFEFISEENPKAAKSVISKILDGIEQLKIYPESGKDGRVPGTKELVISTTSYLIVYRKEENTLEILTVLHSSRKWP